MELYTNYNMNIHCCEVRSNGDQGYEVVEGEDTHVVHLGRKKCTCRTWDFSGIPCTHAIKYYSHDKQETKDHVNWWYSKEAYMLVSMHNIQPIRGSKFLKFDPAHAMEPPEIQNMIGRPKVTRKRKHAESRKREGVWSTSRKELKMACGHCGATCHSKRKCPLLHVAPSSAEVADIERDDSKKDEQPTIQPKRMSESKTRLEAKKVPHRPTGTRKIGFKGDEHGSLDDMEVKNIPLEEGKKKFDVVDKGDVVVLPIFVAAVDEMLVLSDKKVQIIDTNCPWVTKVVGLVGVSVLCFTSSAAVSIFIDTPATYIFDYILGGKLDGSSSTKEAFIQKFIYAVFEGFDPDVDLVKVGIANQTTMLKGEIEDIG
ncbi:4-hydroxy-3-methylbut-2-enyl diphosphate reductase, chloroplastic [Capsicum annuum]|nr:4-hydroxy-3-methylbut-2-enyl diphosphate reductase, chloroplastic [Capsicum annuum]